ncbi:50S ribosomal protein L7/L12, partial [Bacillus mycoides]|uniref:50S ribosomal protein L7/L12 n=1 Tax=Bacillus mycoides TaxID=1405 RepID=UPI003D646895
MTKIESIIEELKSLTLLEAAELVKTIEKTFDVDASSTSNSAMMMMSASGDANVSTETEEKTEFDVILEEVPAPKKISILKVVRSITGLGLKEAKDLVEAAPKAVKEAIAKEEVEEIRKKLEEAGAKESV